MSRSTRILDFLLKCVDTFSASSVIVRFLFFATLLIYICHVVTLGTVSWLVLKAANIQGGLEGLWNRCTHNGEYTCCQTVDSFLYGQHATVPEPLAAARTFFILGLLTGTAAMVMIILEAFGKVVQDRTHILITYTVLDFITASLLFLGITIYGGGYTNNDEWVDDTSVGGSFVVAILVMLFYSFCGILSAVRTIRRTARAAPTVPIAVQPAPGTQRVWTVPQGASHTDNSLPNCWSKMSVGQNFKMEGLSTSDVEYRGVELCFRKTLGTTNATIIKVERIQNKRLRLQYQVMEANMKSMLSNFCSPVERLLWHGTAQGTVESIVTYGFNRSYCGRNATVYGEGVYFAVNSCYSASTTYSPPDMNGNQSMFLCGVLVGRYTQGSSGMRVLPVRTGHILYDSVVDTPRHPSMFVIFNDTQAYPLYLITFR